MCGKTKRGAWEDKGRCAGKTKRVCGMAKGGIREDKDKHTI